MYKALQDSISKSEKLAELSDFAMRVWTYGLAASDMAGRIHAHPLRFVAEAMPLFLAMKPAEVAGDKVAMAIAELVSARLVHLYSWAGRDYMVYHDHDQSGSKNLRWQKSRYPTPPEGLCRCVRVLPGERESTAVGTAVKTAVGTADVHVLSLVHDKGGPGGVEEAVETVFVPAAKPKAKPVDPARAVTERLIHLWNEGKPMGSHIRFTPGRLTKVRARLEHFTEAQLALAIERAKASPHHNGVNDRGWKAPGPEWVLHTVERVEQFLNSDGRRVQAPAPPARRCGVCNDSGEVPAGYLDGKPLMGECSCRRRRQA